MGLPPRKAVVCPGIFVPEHLSQVAIDHKDEQKKSDTAISVVTACRLIAWKGVDLLIEALAESCNTKIELNIYGDGPFRGQLKALTERLGLHQRVTFHGRQTRDQVISAMSVADLFTLTSLHDSQGAVYMEAAELGTPVMMLELGGGADCLQGAKYLTVLNAKSREQALKKIIHFFDQFKPFAGERSESNLPPKSLLYQSNREPFMRKVYEAAMS